MRKPPPLVPRHRSISITLAVALTVVALLSAPCFLITQQQLEETRETARELTVKEHKQLYAHVDWELYRARQYQMDSTTLRVAVIRAVGAEHVTVAARREIEVAIAALQAAERAADLREQRDQLWRLAFSGPTR